MRIRGRGQREEGYEGSESCPSQTSRTFCRINENLWPSFKSQRKPRGKVRDRENCGVTWVGDTRWYEGKEKRKEGAETGFSALTITQDAPRPAGGFYPLSRSLMLDLGIESYILINSLCDSSLWTTTLRISSVWGIRNVRFYILFGVFIFSVSIPQSFCSNLTFLKIQF